jgi:hypothetical protein
MNVGLQAFIYHFQASHLQGGLPQVDPSGFKIHWHCIDIASVVLKNRIYQNTRLEFFVNPSEKNGRLTSNHAQH